MRSEKILKIREYLKNHIIGNVTLTEVASNFKVSGNYLRIIANDIIQKQINCEGVLRNRKGEVSHAVIDKLPGLLGYSYSSIRKNIFKAKIQYLTRPYEYANEKTGKKKLIYARFYNLFQILNLFPRYKYNFDFYNYLDKKILEKFAKVENEIKERDYHVLCWVYSIKNEADIWPTGNEIMELMKNRFSLMSIYRSFNKLMESGFIEKKVHEYSSIIKTRSSYIALKGPRELLLINGRLRDYCISRCKLF